MARALPRSCFQVTKLKRNRQYVGAIQGIPNVFPPGKKMVAHSAGGAVAAAWDDYNFRRKFRHRLGPLSVPLNHASAAQYPRHLSFLS